jgi:hypothetical protein
MSRSLEGARASGSSGRPVRSIRVISSGRRSPLNSWLGVIHSSSRPGTRTLTLPPVAVISDCA